MQKFLDIPRITNSSDINTTPIGIFNNTNRKVY